MSSPFTQMRRDDLDPGGESVDEPGASYSGPDSLGHGYKTDAQAAGQRMVDGIPRPIAALLVQPDTRQGGHQFEPRESEGARIRLAALENGAPEPAARVRRIDEASADPGGIDARIERRLVAVSARITAEQRAPTAPPAARHDLLLVADDDEVGSVVNEGRVDAERPAQRTLDLGRRVVRGTELADRARNEIG
jgi:hypothetical protein